MVPSLHSSPNQPAIFIQDDALGHKGKRVKKFPETENIEIIKLPASFLVFYSVAAVNALIL